ncbi:MAG: glycoside hydrolase family 2 TIM barrel-domain containing protein [Pseudomonadota bacterium]
MNLVQRNRYRDVIDLGGLWGFRADPQGNGADLPPSADTPHAIAIPGSWNEQLAEAGYMNYVGDAWLHRRVFVPPSYAGRRRVLRLAAAGYSARVHANGEFVGATDVPGLPFEADLSAIAAAGESVELAICVSNRELPDNPTPGIGSEVYRDEQRPGDEVFPPTRPDFFPYGGLHGPVELLALPENGLDDVHISTDVTAERATVIVSAVAHGSLSAELTLNGERLCYARGNSGVHLEVPRPERWSPGSPTLYELTVTLARDGGPVDELSLPLGLRSVRCEGKQLLLNDEPVFLRGFGRHEDADISGRGQNLPVMVKDFNLLRWCGANSFRTSHYPYSEAQLDWADRQGVLVVSELASVNLDFRRVTDKTLERHLNALRQQIARDHRHASVIAWSLANEPGYLGEAEYDEAHAGPYWDRLFAEARVLDPSRPLTTANVQYAGLDDPAFERADIIGLNRYYGWYTAPAQIERGVARLKDELDELARRFDKPIALWEFGADAVAGEHATYDQLFTEEYQAALIDAYLELAESHPACVAAHVWNLADFRTAQHFRRVVVNRKGVFTRDRKPKRAAFAIRKRWREDS